MPKFKNTKEIQEVTLKAMKDLQKGSITVGQAEKIADDVESFLVKIPGYKKLKEADNARI